VPPALAAQRRIAQDETRRLAGRISAAPDPAPRRVRRDVLPCRV